MQDNSYHLICPDCRTPLSATGEDLICPDCSTKYPVEGEIADFAQGSYYDEFPGPEALSPEQLQGLENEVAGTKSRIVDFYLPLLRSLNGNGSSPAGAPLRVLDSGCGNGISVDLLNESKIEAWGNDISALRKWQWRERRYPSRLVVADTRKLPFPAGFFDAVLSSGVLEHVGVREMGGASYTVEPLPDRDEARVAFLQELLRVVAPGGKLFLDFPNGAFPIDFWHGTRPGGARFHSLDEGFLPKVHEVREYVRRLGEFTVTPVSPSSRLRMRQVGQHWYGQLFKLPMFSFLKLMDLRPFRFLAGTGLNPYLVLTVERKA